MELNSQIVRNVFVPLKVDYFIPMDEKRIRAWGKKCRLQICTSRWIHIRIIYWRWILSSDRQLQSLIVNLQSLISPPCTFLTFILYITPWSVTLRGITVQKTFKKGIADKISIISFVDNTTIHQYQYWFLRGGGGRQSEPFGICWRENVIATVNQSNQ